jgi:hypothetical protein
MLRLAEIFVTLWMLVTTWLEVKSVAVVPVVAQLALCANANNVARMVMPELKCILTCEVDVQVGGKVLNRWAAEDLRCDEFAFIPVRTRVLHAFCDFGVQQNAWYPVQNLLILA